MRMRLRKTIGFSLALLVASAPAIAKQSQEGQQQQSPHLKAKDESADLSARRAGRDQHARAAARASLRQLDQVRRSDDRLPPQDRYIAAFRSAGRPEIGAAAWYGGHHVGQRTAS